MKLNIQNIEGQIHERLGISDDRVHELLRTLEVAYENMPVSESGTLNLTHAYEEIARGCNDIEEYTVCLHCFVFNAARNGKLLSELKYL